MTDHQQDSANFSKKPKASEFDLDLDDCLNKSASGDLQEIGDQWSEISEGDFSQLNQSGIRKGEAHDRHDELEEVFGPLGLQGEFKKKAGKGH